MYAWLQSFLPLMIATSRKGMIWFSGTGAVMSMEILKTVGPALGWSPEAIKIANSTLLALQAIAGSATIGWTAQITAEDKALKTGLPPPIPGTVPAQTQTVNVGSPVAPPKSSADRSIDHEISGRRLP